jgi:hypothetical protein
MIIGSISFNLEELLKTHLKFKIFLNDRDLNMLQNINS